VIFRALACDYDGTLSEEGRLSLPTVEALKRVKTSGRKLLMVTGRQLDDLRNVCPELDLFDAVVAENGAMLSLPAIREDRLLCEPADETLFAAMKRRGVQHLSKGHGIIATLEAYKMETLEAIEECGLEHVMIFNKGALMVLPAGVTKASGLRVALRELLLSRHNVVSVGDAENDHAFLAMSECAVAVRNALPSLKEHADLVTENPSGRGVVELIDRHLENDMAAILPHLERRHAIELGRSKDAAVKIAAHRSSMLLTGSSGSGKSTLAGVLIEHLVDAERSVCVIDPEGDYAPLADLSSVAVFGGGNDKPLPSFGQLGKLLSLPETSVVLNLHALSLSEKANYVAAALGTMQRVRAERGKPHWLVIDEAHHIFPVGGSIATGLLGTDYEGLCLITVDTRTLAPEVSARMRTITAVTPAELEIAVAAVAHAHGNTSPSMSIEAWKPGEAAFVTLDANGNPIDARVFHVAERRTTHQRHVRKYAVGELSDDRSFWFRGPRGRLKLRAPNLIRFCELAMGVDEATWLYHLRRHEYSQWIRQQIKNEELARDVENAEKLHSAERSRKFVLDAILKRYTA